MVTAKKGKLDGSPKVTRIFYSYEDFRIRLADSSAVHYDIGIRRLDQDGGRLEQTFRLYGTDRRGGVLVYERRWVHDVSQAKYRAQIVKDFIKNIAEPLNGVPGRVEL